MLAPQVRNLSERNGMLGKMEAVTMDGFSWPFTFMLAPLKIHSEVTTNIFQTISDPAVNAPFSIFTATVV